MKRIKLAAIALMAMTTITASAIPARPNWQTVRQADGSLVKVMMVGDEHFHYFINESGQPMEMQQDGNFRLSDKSLAEMQNLRAKAVRKAASLRKAQSPRDITGQKKGIVILAQFPNEKFSTTLYGNQSAHAFWNDAINKRGYRNTAVGAIGSVRDYFYDQSYGQFDLDFDVVGPVTVSHSYSYYGANIGGDDSNPQELIVEACQLVADSVNFKDYDWDGDGEVDQVFVLYAGYGEATNSEMSSRIWPHEFELQYTRSAINIDGVIINTYACGNERYGFRRDYYSPYKDYVMGIGVICHEFSHCLGIMDHYDTQGNNYGMGNWDVMCQGSYNGPNGIGWVPAPYTAYERWYAGWLTPTELSNEDQSCSLQPIVDQPEAYKIQNPGNDNEYYLLENKSQLAWDKYLPADGLLVTHVNYNQSAWENDAVNVGSERMTIIPADNNKEVYDDDYDSLEVGDTYPYNGNDSITDNSTPAWGLTNYNTDGTKLLKSKVINIAKDNMSLVTFDYVAPKATTDGIRRISAKEASEVEAVYNIRGQRTDNLQHGINIVRYKDGTIRKVFVGE